MDSLKKTTWLKIVLFALLSLTSYAQKNNSSIATKIVFACPPCGCDGDNEVSDHPGTCNHCGAGMYPMIHGMKNEFLSDFKTKKVGILVFPGVELIDFTGPWEVLGAAGMQVYAVAKNDSIIHCFPGLSIKPDYTFKNAPKPDILIIPGGNVNPNDTETVSWIKDITTTSEHTASVCTGIYYLGQSGLLDDKIATTFYEAIPDFRRKYSKVTLKDNVRIVDNGKIITAGGLSSGIDLAFYIVGLYQGNAEAKKLANLLEYNWNPDLGFVRGKLADIHLTNFSRLFIPFQFELNEYSGDEKLWKMNYLLKTAIPELQVQDLIHYQASVLNQWNKVDSNTYTFNYNEQKWRFHFQTNQSEKQSIDVLFNLTLLEN